MSHANWRNVAIGDEAKIIMGNSPPGDAYTEEQIGIPLLNGPTEFTERTPSPTKWTEAGTRFANPGDVLFCVRGSTTGRMNVADQNYAIGRGIAAIRGGVESDTRFIHGAIESSLSTLLSLATGSTFPQITARQLADFVIPWPPDNDRQAIAEVLGALDDKIESNRRLISSQLALLRGHAQAVRAASDKRVPLGELVELTIGGVWGEGAPSAKRDTATRILRGVDVNLLARGDVPNAPRRWVSHREAAGRSLEEGDIVIEGSGDCGRSVCWLDGFSTLFEEKVLYTNFCKRLRPRAPASGIGIWLELLDLKERGRLDDYKTGTAMPNLDVKSLLSGLEVSDLTDEQSDQLLASSRALLSPALRRESLVLASLRDSLLPRLISGKLRVQGFGEQEDAA